MSNFDIVFISQIYNFLLEYNKGGDSMQKDLTKGNVLKNIITFSLPFLLSNFLQTFYGMADLFIVGQYNDAASLSGVSIGSQVMHMITVIIVGLAMGSTVMIGRYVGEKKNNEMNKTIGNTLTLFVLVSIILTILLLLLLNPIITIMSTPIEAIYETRLYLMTCFIGIPFITIYNIISSIFRGMGDSKSPMYFVGIACIINILLDFILIGYFNMHSLGAALGTVCSQAVSVMIAFVTIIKRKLLTIKKDDFHINKSIVLDILKIGTPISCQDGFIQVSFIIITIIANSRGVNVAAAVGVVEKIISFLFLVPSSMLSAVSAICAQCIGAKVHERSVLTLKYGCLISIGFGLLFTIICQFVSHPILSLFTSETIVITLGSQYLKAYVFDCIFAGVHFCFSGFYTAYGYSMISFFHNIISIIFVRIPGAYFAAKIYPDTLYPMGLAAPLGSLLSSIICIGIYMVLKKKLYYQKTN